MNINLSRKSNGRVSVMENGIAKETFDSFDSAAEAFSGEDQEMLNAILSFQESFDDWGMGMTMKVGDEHQGGIYIATQTVATYHTTKEGALYYWGHSTNVVTMIDDYIGDIVEAHADFRTLQKELSDFGTSKRTFDFQYFTALSQACHKMDSVPVGSDWGLKPMSGHEKAAKDLTKKCRRVVSLILRLDEERINFMGQWITNRYN